MSVKREVRVRVLGRRWVLVCRGTVSFTNTTTLSVAQPNLVVDNDIILGSHVVSYVVVYNEPE